MQNNIWVDEFPAAIIVCDRDGTIIQMNKKAIVSFEKDGGEKLIGTNILDCHPEPAKSKLKALLISRERNIYTIEKNGVKKLIYQTPWYKDGLYSGFIELSLEIPFEMPHFVRG